MQARHGWLIVGATIITYELLAADGQLLSHGVDQALEAHPVLTRAAILITALHLLNELDDPPLSYLDPFKWVGKLARRTS